ncbi:Mbeg1-like protein [Pleomorphochaeta sp. DL1XJH-081]|uniref:Mbeg1-like protein n=1 Tax=Pleomorphochaeta sp. DL1XJH-081 TaxID=3409690 RepID=UPI003BB71076
MADLYDYLTWRGDITFGRSPLNEIDNLIFSILAYGKYGKIFQNLPDQESLPLVEVAKEYGRREEAQKEKEKNLGFFAEVPLLLEKAAATRRFAKVRLSRFVDELDQNRTIQFAAMVFSMGKNNHYIAFRGTDTNLVGWKEDLQMSFREEIPAQNSGASYLHQVVSELPGVFAVGGHSKGGNVAVFASVKASTEERTRIQAVYNNDGPGFHPEFIESAPYKEMFSRIYVFIPKSSIVGILLEHGGDYSVIGSKQISILQHDPFSWEIEGPHFRKEEGLAKGTLAMKSAIRSWLATVSKEEREQFVKGFCELIEATGAQTLEDLTNDKLQSAYAILRAYTHMGRQSRANLKKTMDILFKESRKSFAETILEGIDHLLPKKHNQKTIESDRA